MENHVGLGESFIAGRIVNLDTADISDLERYMSEVEKSREIANSKLRKIALEIKSIQGGNMAEEQKETFGQKVDNYANQYEAALRENAEAFRKVGMEQQKE